MSTRSSDISNTLKHAVAVASGQCQASNITLSQRANEDAIFLLHSLVMLNDALTTRNDNKSYIFFVAACGTKHVLPVIQKITFPVQELPLKAHLQEGVDSTVARLDEGFAWNSMSHGATRKHAVVAIVWHENLLTRFAERLGVSPFNVPAVVAQVFLKAKATEKPFFYKLASDELTFSTYLVQSRYRLPGTSCEQCGIKEEAGDKPKFRRCGKCRTTLYCSKDCQATDWVAGHRELCKSKVEAEKMGIFMATTGTSNPKRLVPSVMLDLTGNRHQ